MEVAERPQTHIFIGDNEYQGLKSLVASEIVIGRILVLLRRGL
jgi:hypothetical protein